MDKYLTRYKIGSGDLTNKLLISEFCKRRKPIILSSGLAEEQEVIDCIAFIRSQDSYYSEFGSLYLMQCTSMYPIPNSDANLIVLSKFQEYKNIVPGYSDHTEGADALFYSIILGARILEFHFTDDRDGKLFRDHKVSLIPSEVDELWAKILYFDELYGVPKKTALDVEIKAGHVKSFRRGLFFNKDMKSGQVVKKEDLVALRPNVGISAWDLDKIIGKKCRTDVQKLDILNIDMFGEMS